MVWPAAEPATGVVEPRCVNVATPRPMSLWKIVDPVDMDDQTPASRPCALPAEPTVSSRELAGYTGKLNLDRKPSRSKPVILHTTWPGISGLLIVNES
jgi:hypothetical protein